MCIEFKLLCIQHLTGAYGTVYRARDLANPGRIVALKKVRVALTEDGVPMSTLREIALLKQLDAFQHPNIVKWVVERFTPYDCIHTIIRNRQNRLLDVCHGQRTEREGQLVLFLVFEHLEQDLSGYIEALPNSGMQAKTIQVCCGSYDSSIVR